VVAQFGQYFVNDRVARDAPHYSTEQLLAQARLDCNERVVVRIVVGCRHGRVQVLVWDDSGGQKHAPVRVQIVQFKKQEDDRIINVLALWFNKIKYALEFVIGRAKCFKMG
jgi:hypothetical protein